jgi:quinol-cytochrome oxidoreductase complex cytochrome b subunit
MVVALVLIACVMLLAVFFNAPLGEPANPGLTPNPTKAPWYFAGLQELLLHLHPTFAVFVIPLLITVALIILPYVNYEADTRGTWFASPAGRRMAIVTGLAALVVTPLLIILHEFVIKAGGISSSTQPLIAQGLLPTILLAAVVIGLYVILRRPFSATNNEAVQAVFVLLIVALVVMTIVGVWFRGPGMELVLPWNR